MINFAQYDAKNLPLHLSSSELFNHRKHLNMDYQFEPATKSEIGNVITVLVRRILPSGGVCKILLGVIESCT